MNIAYMYYLTAEMPHFICKSIFHIYHFQNKWSKKFSVIQILKLSAVVSKSEQFLQIGSAFLDASSHLYKSVCPSVGPSVRQAL